MEMLTPFEREYLNVLRTRKKKGLPLKRPIPTAKTKLWPVTQATDYVKWLETVFLYSVKPIVALAKEKAKILLMDSLDKLEHTDEEEEPFLYGVFAAELAQQQAEVFTAQMATMSLAIFGLAESVLEFEQKQWQKYATMTIGRAWEESEEWAIEALKEWEATQLSLIKSVGEKQIAMAGVAVREGVRNGIHSSSIAKQLQADLVDLSKAKAKIIARDQVGKLYGILSQKQDENMGVEQYDWRTSADERVRGNPRGKYKRSIPSHFLMHGKTCLWANPTVWKVGDDFVPRDMTAPMVHPGMEIMCRCVSIPRVDIMFDKLIAQI